MFSFLLRTSATLCDLADRCSLLPFCPTRLHCVMVLGLPALRLLFEM